MTRALLNVCSILVLAGCAAAGGAAAGRPGRLPPGHALQREDRVILGQFTDVIGVAVSTRYVFMATPHALGMYDRTFRAWLPPLTPAEGYPTSRITRIAADFAGEGVWLGGVGEVLRYDPAVDQMVRAIVPGAVDAIMFDERDPGAGAYVASGNGWTRVSPTGYTTAVQQSAGALPPERHRRYPPTLRDIYREYPALQSFERLLTRDAQLRSWPVSAAGRAPDVSEVWLGTLGNGIYQVDPLFSHATHQPFGLLDRGAGALALASDGVWVAGLGTSGRRRGGITFASDDLQQWRWLEGPPSGPLAGVRAHALAMQGRVAWVATEHGLVRMDTRNEQDVQFWSMGNGLPADQALAVAARRMGAWVGTARGAAYIPDVEGRRGGMTGVPVERIIAAGVPVRALLLTGDTLWIGSDAGLLLLPPDSGAAPVRAAATRADPRLARPIRALARSDSIVAIAIPDDVLRINLATGMLLPRLQAVDFRRVGPIGAMAMDDRTLWVGGRNGVLVLSRGSGVARFLPVGPREIPGEVYDIELTTDHVWLATRGGLVRLRRLPDGSVR